MLLVCCYTIRMPNFKKRSKRFFHKIPKFKSIIILFGILVLSTASIVFYYRMDPSLLSKISFYVDLANPSMRIVRVPEGLRKEQIAEIMAKKLNWDPAKEEEFVNAHLALSTEDLEGRYFPKTYILHKDETPVAVSTTMVGQFSKEVKKVKKPASKKVIKEDTIITIASIIQREAAGAHDMRLISGILWNRIFKGMKLQVDATLQYAKGTEEDGWWPKVVSADKKIDSSYNTYLHAGLPPGAIANPGLAAISASYNPQKTDCLFYLHDKNRQIHCTKTYEEHKKNVEKYIKQISPKTP